MMQIGIVLFGALAIYLVGLPHTHPWQRWGYVAGICSQPFWFWETWHAQQWGIFAVSFIYAWSWINGFRNHWGSGA